MYLNARLCDIRLNLRNQQSFTGSIRLQIMSGPFLSGYGAFELEKPVPMPEVVTPELPAFPLARIGIAKEGQRRKARIMILP
jgi:hypothetical protein